MMIRILIADDHPLFRDGLRTLLESVDDADIVGEASTGEEAIALAAALEPDVVLMDIKMPGINGIEATRQIVRNRPYLKILMLTMFEDDDVDSHQAPSCGSRGGNGGSADGGAGSEIVRALTAVKYFGDEQNTLHPMSLCNHLHWMSCDSRLEIEAHGYQHIAAIDGRTRFDQYFGNGRCPHRDQICPQGV